MSQISVRLRLAARRSFVMYTELQLLDMQHEAVSVEARIEKHLTQDTRQGPSTRPEAQVGHASRRSNLPKMLLQGLIVETGMQHTCSN